MHYIDPGIDTGDIIDQSTFNIEPVENARTLYDVCLREGIALFKQNVDSIFNLENKRIPQEDSQASYYSRQSLDFSRNRIPWDKDTQSLTNWIRAFIFPPFQLPSFVWEGMEFEVVAVEPDLTKKQDTESPGDVISRDGKIFKIATHDSYVMVATS